MKVIIPMAGKGKRFVDYLPHKPFLEVDGKPMIEHVINYLPKNSEFIFLCKEDHLENEALSSFLKKIVPKAIIVKVPEELLKGPAYTSLAALDYIKDEDEILVNYCDFFQVWDYNDFIEKIRKSNVDGAILSFRGFHPASLGNTYYAYLRVDSENLIKEVREKRSFSDDRTKDFASTGTYYFSNGKLFKKYTKELVSDEKNMINNEFYTSCLYNLMINDNLRIMNYEINKFICLGTPRDYEAYKFWSEFFSKYSTNHLNFDYVDFNITNIFPLAGDEHDFKEMGFEGLNFMLPIMNSHLIEHCIRSNPKGLKNIFIGLEEYSNIFYEQPFSNLANSEFIFLKEKKNGPAATILEVQDRLDPETPVCVSGSTYFLDYNKRKLMSLIERKDIDIIIFSFSHQECVLRDPESFAYAKLKNHIEVEEIIEKKTISENPYLDHALTGTVFFRKAKDLFEGINKEISKDKIAYYLSSINNLIKDKKAVVFEVDKFIPLRRPVNYKEFRYWEDYFHNLPYHPYKKRSYI